MTVALIDNITLTADQQSALKAFQNFLLDPTETVFVLSGYSGCGKSTLVRVLLDQLPKFLKAVKLIDPYANERVPILTATTNKAAENLQHITGMPVSTIHSALGLRVVTDFKTGNTTLAPRKGAKGPEDALLFIDEASYLDSALLQQIFQRSTNCKFIFIGDPAQLTPVKSSATPVFNSKFNGAQLTQVVRQAEGNPIVDLSTKFRHAVNTGQFFSFKPDGHAIRHLSREEFHTAIAQEFTREDWHYADSKILAWTNKAVVSYNQFVRNLVKGDPHFQVGDYAVCNSFIQSTVGGIKTDQLVQITQIDETNDRYGVPGKLVEVDHREVYFLPNSLKARNKAEKDQRDAENWAAVSEIERTWIDLRGAYACTINKAQGSTYDKVFIDLDDISRCTSGDQIARMMYVAVSRARTQVFLTGDLA